VNDGRVADATLLEETKNEMIIEEDPIIKEFFYNEEF